MIRENIYEKAKAYFLKPVEPLMLDPTVSEIMIVGHDCIYYERAGKLYQSDATFGSESRLQAAVRNIGEYSAPALMHQRTAWMRDCRRGKGSMRSFLRHPGLARV